MGLYIRGRSPENGESHVARVDRQNPAREQSRRAFQLVAACLTRTRAGKCRMSAEIARIFALLKRAESMLCQTMSTSQLDSRAIGSRSHYSSRRRFLLRWLLSLTHFQIGQPLLAMRPEVRSEHDQHQQAEHDHQKSEAHQAAHRC